MKTHDDDLIMRWEFWRNKKRVFGGYGLTGDLSERVLLDADVDEPLELGERRRAEAQPGIQPAARLELSDQRGGRRRRGVCVCLRVCVRVHVGSSDSLIRLIR